ncbi:MULTISPECIES: YceI family protein [Thalassospira]|uniref:Polyisoprenoid-binding protein n=2 Tax=Thalassospira tepidiphila TaxID=393657 RepID=A0A853L273_9PROT|nr:MULTISPECIES: YceI family protein [Thalassospira]MBO6578992.1 YceI family protein [Thalassospira sp.]MBO6803384.1 YceI family protein [Thalassospira sp.]MBO6818728.1 YceI family protein [Thalassospira sp.]MBO6890262.1 YceI family protein [Thalassospira sp.]NJB74986.1 polyisoprenoid-binding protein YceI [Thalassospira tepidiphila]
MFQMKRKMLPVLAIATTIAGFSGAALAADQWVVEANDSEIEFTGTQLGAAFEGKFESFEADIVFSPDDLAGSSVEVLIDIASVNTSNGDRDSQIVSPDWFDAAQWPTAKFATKSFSEIAPGKYEAVADLTIRDVTREVTLPFDLEIEGNKAEAEGTVTINRTDFGVGQGQWQDTSQVGDAVTIKIEIEAMRP